MPASTSSATVNSPRAATGPSISTTACPGFRPVPSPPEEAKDPLTQAGGGNDRKAFPEFYAEYDAAQQVLGKRLGNRFVCNGEIKYVGRSRSRATSTI